MADLTTHLRTVDTIGVLASTHAAVALVRAGLIRATSDMARWELTPAGRARLDAPASRATQDT